jgi:hypothetical protein
MNHVFMTLLIKRTLHLIIFTVPREFTLIVKEMYNVPVAMTQNFPFQTYHPFYVSVGNCPVIVQVKSCANGRLKYDFRSWTFSSRN